MGAWYIGAAINLVGSIMINLGTNVMKLGHNKRGALDMPEEEKPPVTRFREWQIGTAVFIIGNVANFVSFGYAAQSLLAALGSVQFVSNVFFASFVLKEKVTAFVIIATCCIIGGCMLLVIFGNHSSDDYTVEQLLALYRVPAYIVYLVMMFVFVLGSYIVYLHGKHVASQKGRQDSLWVSILPVSYSIFSALLGTQSVLFSKSLSVLLRTTFAGDSQLGNWYTWVTLLCFLISAGFWVTRLNKGLRLFPAMIIVPLMQICWTLFSIVSGMIYFQEYVAFNPATAKHGPLNAIMFALGVMIVFVGVFLLTKGAAPPAEEYEDLDEKVKQDELEMVTNPAYAPEDPAAPGTPHTPSKALAGHTGGHTSQSGPDPDVPQKDKLSMDTLRFTSLASSTAHNKTGYKGQRMKSSLNTTMTPQRALNPHDSQRSDDPQGGSFKRTAGAADGEEARRESLGGNSMMGTLKKGAKKLQMRLRSDFNVDPEDFKQMFGMGQGGYVPALSLFAMPGVDLMSSRQRPRNEYGTTPRHNTSIVHNLPSSRFYAAKDVEGGLHETHSEDLDRASEPLIGGGATSHQDSVYLIRNSSLPGSFTRQGLGGVAGASSSSGLSQIRPNASFTVGGTSGTDPGSLREIMSKTMRQMEDVAGRARSSVEASLLRYKEQQKQVQAEQYQSLGQEAAHIVAEGQEEGEAHGSHDAHGAGPSGMEPVVAAVSPVGVQDAGGSGGGLWVGAAVPGEAAFRSGDLSTLLVMPQDSPASPLSQR